MSGISGRRSIHKETNQRASSSSPNRDDFLTDEACESENDSTVEPVPNKHQNVSKLNTGNGNKPDVNHKLSFKSAPSRNGSISASTDSKYPKECSKDNSFIYFKKILVLMTVLVALAAYWYYSHMSNTPKTCSYSDLSTKYNHEDDELWKHLKSGVEDIQNGRSEKPGVYLFAHSGGKRAKELIRDIANKSSSCLDSSRKPVEIESIDFTSPAAVNDYGVVIEKYKRIIKNGNVILIANLNEIPAKAARALHAICDTESPIAKKVIIYLSIVFENKEGKLIDNVVHALQELWESKIVSNELGPLITRVTDEVMLLQSN